MISSMSNTSGTKRPPEDPACSNLRSQIVSLKDFWGGIAEDYGDKKSIIPLMDLRSSKDYHRERLVDSRLLVVPFPMTHLKQRSYELPARHVEFSILLYDSDLEAAEEFLLGPKAGIRKRPRKPWRITNVLVENPELWEQAKTLGICETSILSASNIPHFPFPRLWQSDPIIETVLLPLLKVNDSSAVEPKEIWDLASGAGRDVAFLAEELLAAKQVYTVIGFDHRYNEKETGTTQGFWDRRGVGEYTKCVKMDLSDWDRVTKSVPLTNVAVLFAVRFWKPDLVAAIANSAKLASGTLFALSHFCRPHAGAPWNFEHPSEKTVLERNQLSDLFKEEWEILHDEIALDSDHGRTMVHFVAKKR